MEILVRNWINGNAQTYSYYIKTEISRYKVSKNIGNEQFIIKKGQQDNGKRQGERKEENKLEHCWTQHKKKRKKQQTFLGKIDSV